jgi:hypothetical protein
MRYVEQVTKERKPKMDERGESRYEMRIRAAVWLLMLTGAWTIVGLVTLAAMYLWGALR